MLLIFKCLILEVPALGRFLAIFCSSEIFKIKESNSFRNLEVSFGMTTYLFAFKASGNKMVIQSLWLCITILFPLALTDYEQQPSFRRKLLGF